MKARAIILTAAALASASCVPYPGPPGPGGQDQSSQSQAATQISFEPLDEGAVQVDSLHFSVHAYGDDAAHQVSAAAETAYGNLMMDANFYSFQPRNGLYQIYVYADQAEYLKKTSQPEWSDSVINGNAIYAYAGPQLNQTLAYQITQMVFLDYMQYPGGTLNPQHAWVVDGLAAYEQERTAGGGSALTDIFSSVRSSVIQQPVPIDQLANLVPASNANMTSSAWYCEAESLVQFMIEHGSRTDFSQFLAGLQKGQSFDDAVAAGFPGVWSNLIQFYGAWKSNLLPQ